MALKKHIDLIGTHVRRLSDGNRKFFQIMQPFVVDPPDMTGSAKIHFPVKDLDELIDELEDLRREIIAEGE